MMTDFNIVRRLSATTRSLVATLLGLALMTLAVGCDQSPSAYFRLNLEGREPADFAPGGALLEGAQNAEIALAAMFGTPDDPYVFSETGLDLEKIRLASGPSYSQNAGKQRGLYRQHCAHCHGVTGDGAGPTAVFLNPYPRDYRRGIYKFKSTEASAKPTREDLKRVLVNGVPGTAMPSFRLLPNDELDALVEYVLYLTMRGEVETLLMLAVEQEDPIPLESRDDLVADYLEPVVAFWEQADSQVVTPPAPPAVDTPELMAASINAGRELFQSPRAQCTKCHGPTALGDGSDENLFDDWNKDKDPERMALWLLPQQQLNPRNLRLGVYHGGRRPLDIYRRIHAGIKGTPMPAAGKTETNPGVLTSDEIWHLVHYVRSLPYEEIADAATPEQTAARARN